MKILNKDLRHGKVSLHTESLEDLWYLNQLIDAHDFVSGKTLRKIKVGGEDQRSQKVVRKPMFIEIEVEKLDFTPDMLRVTGVVRQGPEDIPFGTYHSFNVDSDTAITITKKRWLKFQLDKLDEAASGYASKVLLCVHDREEAHFALMKRYGYELLSSIRGNVAKKDERAAHDARNFYAEIVQAMHEYVDRHSITQVIVASPAFWKEELQREIKDERLKRMISFATCSSVGPRAFDEVLRRPEVQNALKKERVAREVGLVEDLLAGISKGSAVAYGLEEVRMASEAGAVSGFLITDKFIQRARDDDRFAAIEDMMNLVESAGGQINIISSDNEAGSKLDGLGGIGAILRYKLNS